MNTFAQYEQIKNDHRLPSPDCLEGIHVTDGPCQTSPETAGFDPVMLARLDCHFAGLIKAKRLQCASYLLARKGKVFAHRALGTLKVNDPDTPLRPDSLRYIASITKLFTAVGIMKLYEDGLLDIHAPVSALIPEFGEASYKRITPVHLLTHTSGLTADSGYFQESFQSGYPFRFNRDPEWIKNLLSGVPQSEPGQTWSYSSAGFSFLGECIARASGMSYPDYITQNISIPLGLKDTTFYPSAAQWKRNCITDPQFLDRKNKRPPSAHGSPPAAGGLTSTLPDLFRLGQTLLCKGTWNKRRLLGRKTVEALVANRLHHIPAFCWGRKLTDMPYSLGLALGKDRLMGLHTFGHEGAGASCLFIDPEKELVAAYFTPSPFGWTQEAVDNPRAMIWGGLD